MVICCSNMHKITEPASLNTDLRYRGINLTGLNPFVSEEGARQLASVLNLDDLKGLARRCGISQSKNSNFILQKTC